MTEIALPLAALGVACVDDLAALGHAILTELAAPRSTTELAERVSLSPATGSHHLAGLREAGLVTGRREGRSVLYARTSLGDALVEHDRP